MLKNWKKVPCGDKDMRIKSNPQKKVLKSGSVNVTARIKGSLMFS